MKVRNVLKCKSCQDHHVRIKPRKALSLSEEDRKLLISGIMEALTRTLKDAVDLRNIQKLSAQLDCPQELVSRICDLASITGKTVSVFLQDLLLSHGYFLSSEQQVVFEAGGGISISLGKDHYAENAMIS